MASAPVEHAAAERLYALRLRESAGAGGLQGEIEHVVTGERHRFVNAADLMRWLQRHHADGLSAPRDATT